MISTTAYCKFHGSIQEITATRIDARLAQTAVPAAIVRAKLACGHRGNFVMSLANVEAVHARAR